MILPDTGKRFLDDLLVIHVSHIVELLVEVV